MLLWFHNELANLKNTNIEVTIYVTQATQKDLGDHDNDKFTKVLRVYRKVQTTLIQVFQLFHMQNSYMVDLVLRIL